MLAILGSLGAIVLVDLTLSGDNALIIGAAASGLERRQRMLAILTGGGAAIVLRILFTIAAALLFGVPLLEAIGGAVLIVIAVRLLLGRGEHAPAARSSKEVPAAETRAGAESGHTKPAKVVSLRAAMLTILVADVTMSLDNILAVGGLAHSNITLLVVGLALSIAILMVGSAIVAELIERLPWLLDVAGLVLGWTAGSMIYNDHIVGPYLHVAPFAKYIIPALGVAIVLAIDIGIRVWERRRAPTLATPEVKRPDGAEAR